MPLNNGLDQSHVTVECDRSLSSQQTEVDWSSCNGTSAASLLTGQYHSGQVDDVNASVIPWLLANVSADNETYMGPMDGPEPLSNYIKAFITILYTIVIVVAVGGNTIVCCIVITQRRMHTVTNFFIVSLACSDILMASLCIPLTFVANVVVEYWPFGALLCPIASYGQVRLRNYLWLKLQPAYLGISDSTS
jgi:hypothetical protein